MAYRRNAWARPLPRKVGASSLVAPGVSGITRFWDSTKWYPAVDWLSILGSGLTNMQYSGGFATNKVRVGLPFTFDRAGTITAIGQHVGNINTRIYLGIYTSDDGNPVVPTTLDFSVEKVSPGFNNPVTNACAVSVRAGETKWFAQISNVDDSFWNVAPTFIKAEAGTNWDGVTATGAPVARWIHGYRTVDGAYAALPNTWPAGDTPLLSNAINVPCPMFKFTPA